MHPIIQKLEQEQMHGKIIPAFKSGDTVIVKIKIKEGERERLQSYEGVVIAKKNRGLNSSFTVRKISHGEGVERVFQTYSPQIESIAVKRRGDVRKAKLYHLRDLSGRKARIREKIQKKVSVVDIVGKAPLAVVGAEAAADFAVDNTSGAAQSNDVPSNAQVENNAETTETSN